MSVAALRALRFNLWAEMLLTVVVVVLANTLAARHFVRVDLSRDRLYSLDEASKALVGRLDRPLLVRVYLTGGLEAPYNNHAQIVRDKLEEYVAYSGGRVRVEMIDPGTDPEASRDAQKLGLTPLEYTVREQDRAELRKVWMGAVLLYGERQEVLPTLTNLATLEYDVSSAIVRLVAKREDRRVLAWSIGHGEPDWLQDRGPLKGLAEQLGRSFELRAVPLGGPGLIPEDVDILLVVGPQEPLVDRALYQLDQFLMRGGAAGVFVTHHRPDLRTLRSTKVVSGLEPLLGHYGVKVNQDLVLDRVQNGALRFPVRAGKTLAWRDVNYAGVPKATALSPDSVLVSGLGSMVFPFASSVELAGDLGPGVTGEVLATTGPAAGAVPGLSSLDPALVRGVLPDEKRGPFALLVALTGPLRSFFETRPVPPPEEGAAPTTEAPEPDGAPIVEGASTRLVVAGSADFIANNPAFVLNLADWLAKDEALIGIRSKVAKLPALAATTPGERLGWKAFNLAAGPLLLFAFGAWRQLRLRRRAAAARRTA